MKEFFIPVLPASKPTGNVGSGGNLYQNTATYTKFKIESLKCFKEYEPYETLQKCDGILIVGFLPKLRCRPKDLGQLNGAIYDILTTAKVWRDDNLGIVSCNLAYYFYDLEVQGYYVALAEKPSEWDTMLLRREQAKNIRELFKMV
jgi:Holliday junction resolvase RusA-like endonuclease